MRKLSPTHSFLFCSLRFFRSLALCFLVQNLQSQIKHRSIIYHHQTSIRSRLQMNAYAFSFLKILSAEEIPYGVHT